MATRAIPVRSALVLGVLAAATAVGGGLASARGTAPRPAGGPIAFHGNGARTLPPFRVTRPSTLFWSNDGAIFQISASGAASGNVNSQAASGATYLAPRRYTLQVNGDGNWTIRIAPGVEKPKTISAGVVGYRGNGGRDLPPFRLPRSEQVHWTCSGLLFQTFDNGPAPGRIAVNSQAHEGSIYARAGVHQVTVAADGNWVVAWHR